MGPKGRFQPREPDHSGPIGLPDGIAACLFDLDGVVTQTARVHARAWKETFESALHLPFDEVRDYDLYVDGKPREDGVRSFLQARGMTADPALVARIAGQKDRRFLELIHEHGVQTYPGTIRYMRAARRLGKKLAVVSSSRHTTEVLRAASLIDAFDAQVDGIVAEREHLRGKPAPDTYIEAAVTLLIARVGRGRSEHVRQVLKSGWGGMLKPAARNGLLCFGPSRGQSVTFVRPESWLPSWRTVDPDQAIVEMARRYLRVYGPATKLDFARWWGAWPGVANAAWKGLAPDLVPVSVEGVRGELLAPDVPAIKRSTLDGSVQLLPLFDPYLMGHAKRDHLVDRAFASRVSRTAGWISATVLVDGRVAGTWTHALSNQTLRVTVEPFRKLPSRVLSRVRKRAVELGDAMGAKKSQATIA